jgi:hypothetical protein
MFETINNLVKLKETVEQLFSMRAKTSSEDFSKLVQQFEIEVDRLNDTLQEQFSSDSEVMQLVYEIKSAVVALRYENVERVPSIS